jgi:crossover junction endodeoxyribonuclease RusA
MSISIELPWPPSVNNYWIHRGRGTFISDAGIGFIKSVRVAIVQAKIYKPMLGKLQMSINLFPPDKRRRDIDNVLKALLDALTKGGLMEDDSQVKRLDVEMMNSLDGRVEVYVKNYARHETNFHGV